MTLEQILILKWFIIPAIVIVIAIPSVFVYAYVSERKKRNRAKKGKR